MNSIPLTFSHCITTIGRVSSAWNILLSKYTGEGCISSAIDKTSLHWNSNFPQHWPNDMAEAHTTDNNNKTVLFILNFFKFITKLLITILNNILTWFAMNFWTKFQNAGPFGRSCGDRRNIQKPNEEICFTFFLEPGYKGITSRLMCRMMASNSALFR